MKEIKYRIWDKKKAKMIYPKNEDLLEELALEREESHLVYCDMEDIVITLSGDLMIADECGHSEYLEKDRFIPTQYTGLKDKNGNEIYEGDILYYEVLMQGYEVRWDEHNACFFAIDKNGQRYRASAFNQMSKIGNIYENPGLLEEI